MKIREQCIHDFEIVRRINEDASLARKSKCRRGLADYWIGGLVESKCFEHADGGSAYGDHAAMFAFCGGNGVRGFFAQCKALFMHWVSGDVFGFHRRKSCQANVQREKTNLHASRADFFEQAFGEMKSCRGRRH